MPTVPTYNRQVQESALPSVRGTPQAPAASFGIGTSMQKAINQFGNKAMAFMAQEKKNADDLAILEADKNLSSYESELVSGALNRKGKDTLGLEDEIMGSHTKYVNDTMKGMANNAQKSKFMQIAVSRQKAVQQQLNKHTATEMAKWDKDVTDTFISNERDNAVVNFDDPNKIAVSIQRQREAIMGYAQRNGIDPAVGKRNAKELESETHRQIINHHLSNGNDLAAQGYYKAIEKNLTAEDITKLKDDLREGSTRGEANRQLDKILAKTDDRAMALDMAKKEKNPEIRDLLTTKVNKAFDDKKKAKVESQQKLKEGIINMLQNNPGSSPRDVIPPEIWNYLSPKDRKDVSNYLKDPVTDEKTKTDFLTMTPYERANISPVDFELKYKSKLSKDDKTLADKLYKEAKSGKNLTSASSWSNKLENTFRRSNLISRPDKQKSKWSKDEYKSFLDIEAKAREELESFEQIKGRKATGAEQQEMLDNVLLDTVYLRGQTWGWGSRRGEVVRATVTDDEKGRIYVPWDKIDKNNRVKIIQLLQNKNIKAHRYRVEDIAGAIGDNDRIGNLLQQYKGK